MSEPDDSLQRPIHFYLPSIKRYETSELAGADDVGFAPVSVTGSRCALQCDHCAAKLLRRMPAAATPEALYQFASQLKQRGGRGLLITGGSDADGQVPLKRHLLTMRRIKDELGLVVSVHTGLVDQPLAEGLATAGVDRVMLDVIGHAQTISEVYHLRATPDDFFRSVELLVAADLEVVPHVVIGLHYGSILGERTCLQRLSHYPLHALVLVILSFTEDTPMAAVAAPPVASVAELFRLARQLFTKTPIILGCARPPGRYKEAVDREAVLAGLDGIAYPAEGLVAFSRGRGRKPVVSYNCCSL